MVFVYRHIILISILFIGYTVHGYSEAYIKGFISDNKILAESESSDWKIGEVVAIQSMGDKKNNPTQDDSSEIIGFLEVSSIESLGRGVFQLKLELVRHSRFHFVRIGDKIISLDLTKENVSYKGTTDLIIRNQIHNASSRYKPFFLLGTFNGETAQVLWKNEVLVTAFGLFEYGVFNGLTVGTLMPAVVNKAPNLFFKSKLFESESNIVSAGLLYVKIPDKTQSTLNLNFYWDSVSSTSVINHTWLSVALFTYDSAEKATAIRSIGTSSMQTGYEFILNNWDRVIVGPNFNVEKKSVGGYLAYVFIWDQFHLQLSLSSNNISSLKIAPEDGYYPFVDAYWRF